MPLVGVVGQPFWKLSSKGEWTGRIVWGFDIDGKKMSSIPPVLDKKSKKNCSVLMLNCSKIYKRYFSMSNNFNSERHKLVSLVPTPSRRERVAPNLVLM